MKPDCDFVTVNMRYEYNMGKGLQRDTFVLKEKCLNIASISKFRSDDPFYYQPKNICCEFICFRKLSRTYVYVYTVNPLSLCVKLEINEKWSC